MEEEKMTRHFQWGKLDGFFLPRAVFFFQVSVETSGLQGLKKPRSYSEGKWCENKCHFCSLHSSGIEKDRKKRQAIANANAFQMGKSLELRDDIVC